MRTGQATPGPAPRGTRATGRVIRIAATLAAALLLAPGAVGAAVLLHTSPPVTGHQGYATDGTLHHVIDTRALRTYDATWGLLRANLSATAGTGRDHLGDGDLHRGLLYAPLETWRGCGDIRDPAVAVYDAATLALRALHPLEGAYEAAAVAVVPPGDPHGLGGPEGRLYVVSYCGDQRILVYDLATFRPLAPILLTQPLRAMQGLAYREGHFLIQDSHGRVFSADARISPAVVTLLFIDEHPGTGEGLDHSQPELRLHRDTGGEGGARVYTYRLSTLPAVAGPGGIPALPDLLDLPIPSDD